MIKEVKFDINHYTLFSAFEKLDILSLLKENNNQISVQHRGVDGGLQLTEGCSSLAYDWYSYDSDTHARPPLKKIKIDEKSFTQQCDLFKNTYVGEVIDKLVEQFGAYRGRFMLMKYRTCLTMHVDNSPRLHIPIVTNPNAFMVINNIIYKFPFGKTYLVDTRLPHTAINAGEKDRVHLVFCVSNF